MNQPRRVVATKPGDAARAWAQRLGRAGPGATAALAAAFAHAAVGRAAAAPRGRAAAAAPPLVRPDRCGPRRSAGNRPFDPACATAGCRCPPGWDACGTDRCRFLPMAHAHCGACGVACRPDQLCSNGRCV